MATCLHCGDEFEAKRADAQFCKDAHRKAFVRAKKAEGATADNPAITPDTVIPDTAIADTSDRRLAAELLAQADRLTQLQKDERGTLPGPTVDGKTLLIPGPYVPTPERESRAAQIISLRKQAANLRFPVAA